MKTQYTGYLGALNENAKYLTEKEGACLTMQEARCCMKKKLREIHCDYAVGDHMNVTSWFYILRIETVIPGLVISLAMHDGPTPLIELAWVQDRTKTIEPFYTEYDVGYSVVTRVINELVKLEAITKRRYE